MSALLLFRYWRESVIGILLLVIVALWIGKGAVERQNDKLKTSLQEAMEMIETERATVRNETALARAKDAAHAATVERNQLLASQEVTDDYQKQLAALRARYDTLRLRQGAPATDPGRSGAEAVSWVSDATAGIDGTTSAAGLSDPDRLIASEQAIRLKALQDWVAAQINVKR